VGGFEAIASHVKNVAKTPADPVARISNGVFCCGSQTKITERKTNFFGSGLTVFDNGIGYYNNQNGPLK